MIARKKTTKIAPTSGPWEIHEGEDYIEVREKRRGMHRVIYCRRHPDDEDIANAKLIAAAPDMAEALKALFAEVRSNASFRYPENGSKVCELARAALAKPGVS